MRLRREPGDLLQGTLGILILKALLPAPAHGYAISRWIEDTTSDVLRVEEGSLYPALRRLAESGAHGSLFANVDGPYGSPSAHIFDAKNAVLIGAGIGVTPFARFRLTRISMWNASSSSTSARTFGRANRR